MTKSTTEVLNHLENTLKEKHPFLFNLLNVGSEKNDIIGRLKGVGLFPNDSLINLFYWRNGIGNAEEYTIGELQLFSLGIFEPLEWAIEAYKIFCLEKQLWAEGLFPVFSSGGGDYYLMNLNNKDFKDGGIYLYSPSLLFVEPEYMFRDLDSLLEIIAACYENSTYSFDGDLIVDRDKEEEAFENAK